MHFQSKIIMGFFKIRYFFLIILVVSLAFHSPINNTAFATDGSSISEVLELEHGTSDATYNSLIHMGSNKYVLAYTDSDGDGFIKTFTISSDGSTITEVTNFEHNTADGTHHSAVMVDSDTYLLAYASSVDMGKISTHTITGDGTVTSGNIVKYEHETAKATYNSLVKVDSDTYALAYTGGGDDGHIQTFTVPSDGSSITKVTNEEHNTSDGTHNSLIRVDADTYALAYASTSDMGKIATFTITADGTTITELVDTEHETNKATYNSLVKVDSDTYALAYTGGGDDGHIQTFTIPGDGSSITKVTNLEHDTSDATHNSLIRVDADTYALAYTGTDGDGFIKTFTISADGTTITEVTSSEHNTSDATYNSLVKVYSDMYALAYTGPDDDGFIQTFTISGPTASNGGGGNSSCDSHTFGLNESLKVNQVSYNIETFELVVQAYSTCGPIVSKVTTPDETGILGLSINQPLLDEKIAIYSTYLKESDEKFRITLENDRNSFDETFYIHDKSIIKTYKGYSHYTSEQHGTIYTQPEPISEPTFEPEPISEPTFEPEPEPISETGTNMSYWFVVTDLIREFSAYIEIQFDLSVVYD